MKVKIDISPEHSETYAIICSDRMTDEVKRAVDLLGQPAAGLLTASLDEKTVILRANEIYMVRIENEKAVIFDRDKRYISRKRLYELKEVLGDKFIQISKGTIINPDYLDRIEPGFGGSINIKMRNGLTESISRRFLPGFKKYLGL